MKVIAPLGLALSIAVGCSSSHPGSAGESGAGSTSVTGVSGSGGARSGDGASGASGSAAGTSGVGTGSTGTSAAGSLGSGSLSGTSAAGAGVSSGETSSPFDASTDGPSWEMGVGEGAATYDATGPGETGSATSCSVAQVGPDGDFKGYRMFPANHPINTRIDTLAVNTQSANWLANCSPSAPHLQLDPSMPYNIVPASTPPVTATKLDYNSTPYPNPWPFPANAVIEGGDPTTPGDHHCLAFDVGQCGLYEVYNILWSADKRSFTAASGTVWDTTSNAPGNGSGSDAAGLPIIPLLFRYDELIGAGAIDHALRFTCAASQQGHIAPARASASSSAGSGVPADPHDPTFPPMGMRVRLKASYDPTAHGFPPLIVTLLTTLQEYGIILADNGGKDTPMFITGASDQPLQDALSGPAYLMKSITTDDLEVVDTGPVESD